jgi:CheY-like chemotaxis protein
MSNMSKDILVVEDEPASLECISHFLRKQGYEVREARDGAEAIELIDNSQFDLVLSDIRMPRVDGVALATNILSRVPTIPIIPDDGCSIRAYAIAGTQPPVPEQTDFA